MLLHGDCLKELQRVDTGSISLVYLDPPFFTQKKHSLKSRDNASAYSFDDTWENISSYKDSIQQRLVECRRVLKDSGSIFLHCDRTASHHLRAALDEVFGDRNFQSEIIWSYKRWSNAKNGLLNSHQVIFFYSKTREFKFNKTFEAYSPTTNIDQIFQKRERDKNGKTRYKAGGNGDPELVDEKFGVPLSDVWEIPYLNPKANERVGYPTQKPINLLERIVQLVTDRGDIVLDPYCGSGTTLVAAALLERKYIGIDISEDALILTKKRLANPIKSESLLMKNGKDSYINQQDEKILKILDQINAMPVQRNKGIDGFMKLRDALRPVPVKIQREHESLEMAQNLLLQASKKSGFKVGVLVKTSSDSSARLFYSPETPRENLLVVESGAPLLDLTRRLEQLV